jgi:hypothetical protein
MKRTFEQWLREVDAFLIAECGLGHEDLPDVNYAEMYERGTLPRFAARHAIKSAGG